MASLEGVRAVFDRGGIGFALIGMPVMELAPFDEKAVIAVIRITGSNFRLIDR